LLLQAKWLIERGLLTESGLAELPESVVAELPEEQSIAESIGRQSWRARQFVKQARMFSFEQLAGALERLLEFDLRLKGGEGAIEDRRLGLEMLCLSLISLRARQAGRQQA
jgi:DNA polymerase III delta subunit